MHCAFTYVFGISNGCPTSISATAHSVSNAFLGVAFNGHQKIFDALLVGWDASKRL